MEQLIIEGGHRLSGHVRPGGNKNEALPVLAATLLTEEPVVLHNLPNIRDVGVMMDLLRSLGCSVERRDDGAVRVQARALTGTALDPVLCQRIRASILLAGPMLGRMGAVSLAPPGGDVIGRRRLDSHFRALSALGTTYDLGEVFHLRAAGGRLAGAHFFMDEPSVTGTENAVMAAVLARGTTVLENVACEPHVQGLCHLLVAMGARISGIGTHILRIEGVDRLGGADHHIGSDYLEIGSMIALGAASGGALTIEQARPDDLRMIRLVFARLGVRFDVDDEGVVHLPADQELRIQPDLAGAIPVVSDAPWPQFPTDLMSIAIVLATQCTGTCIFFEKMFEGRMFFVDHLQSMGAQIILCDPHRVVTVGPSQLVGGRVESPDVRAGMAMLIAALVAQGRTRIGNVRQIDRGYSDIDAKLRALGAVLERRQA